MRRLSLGDMSESDRSTCKTGRYRELVAEFKFFDKIFFVELDI